jgi:hypothetical protein
MTRIADDVIARIEAGPARVVTIQEARELIAEIRALRERLGQHVLCSRFGPEDFKLLPERAPERQGRRGKR